MTKVIDFIPEFVTALTAQLISDEKRWEGKGGGDTFLKRTREGQEDRIYDDFDRYYKDWEINKVPIPWLKIIGNALIGWIREQHPEIWPK